MAKGWEQRQADRVLKGQEHANLVTPWVYTARLEHWRDPHGGSPRGAKGEREQPDQ